MQYLRKIIWFKNCRLWWGFSGIRANPEMSSKTCAFGKIKCEQRNMGLIWLKILFAVLWLCVIVSTLCDSGDDQSVGEVSRVLFTSEIDDLMFLDWNACFPCFFLSGHSDRLQQFWWVQKGFVITYFFCFMTSMVYKKFGSDSHNVYNNSNSR